MKSAKIFVANFDAVLKKSFFNIITYFFYKSKVQTNGGGCHITGFWVEEFRGQTTMEKLHMGA